MNTSPLFEMMRKTQEAYRVRHGLPVERQYTDDELVESMYGLDDAERILNRRMSDEERLGRLSPDEPGAYLITLTFGRLDLNIREVALSEIGAISAARRYAAALGYSGHPDTITSRRVN